MLTENEVFKRQFRENEQSANRAVAIVSLSFFAIFLALELLIDPYYAELFSYINRHVFLPISVVLVVCGGVALHFDFDRPWIKYMLLGCIEVMCFSGYFVCTNYAAFLVIMPIFIATRYFDRRLLVQTAAVTLVFFLLAVVGNLYLDENTELFQLVHYYMSYDPWDYALDAFIFVVVPLALNILFFAYYAFNVVKDGRRLIHAHAEGTVRMAAVDVELDMAAHMQQTSLPSNSYTTENGNFVLSAQEIPAREVGGDFFGHFMVDEHTLCVLIADVSDKGVSAALFMMSAKKAIECAVSCSRSLEDAVALANKLICRDNNGEMFLTLWIGMVDIRTGKGKYANAGHMPPIVKHADGSAEWMECEPDLFLGNFPDMPPAAHCLSLDEGDVLLLYTDGVTDAENKAGEGNGRAHVLEASLCSPACADAQCAALIESAQRFSGDNEQFDDMTVLALQCVRVDAPRTERYCVEASYDGTRALVDCVDALLIELDCPDNTRREVGVILDEIGTNIAENAYPEACADRQDADALNAVGNTMELIVEAGCNYLEMRMVDRGIAFDPLTQADPEIDDEPQIGGFGIYFIRQLADEVSYERVDGCNVLSVRVLWNI